MTTVQGRKALPRMRGEKKTGWVLALALALLVLLAAGFPILPAPEAAAPRPAAVAFAETRQGQSADVPAAEEGSGAKAPARTAGAGQVSLGGGRQRLTAPQDTWALPYQPSGILDQRTYTSTGDAVIMEGYPSTNFGSQTLMWAGYDDNLEPDGEIVRSLVRFNPNTLPPGATITKATLRLFMDQSYDWPDRTRAIQTHDVTGSWTEAGVTWYNQPGYGAGYGFTNILSEAWGWHEFDVTGLVQDWHSGAKANNGIMVRGPEFSGSESSWRGFSTREGPYPPQLVVEYTVPTNTPPTLSGLPDQTLPKNGSKNQAIDLWQHAHDGEDPDVALTFSITNTPDAQAGLSLSGNRFINLNPATDWTGQTDVVVQVRDTGGLTDTDTFRVTVSERGDYLIFLPLAVRDRCGFAAYFDDFSDPGSGWYTGSNQQVTAGYLNGEYQLKIKTRDNQAGVTPDLFLPEDYVIEVDARQTTAQPSALGIMFGIRSAAPNYEGYQFVIFPHRREFLLEKRMMDGSWQILVDSLYHSAIQPGTSTNRLRVERTGTAIKLYVNDTHLLTKNDASFIGAGRDAGVRVYSYDKAPVDGRFDNFRAACP